MSDSTTKSKMDAHHPFEVLQGFDPKVAKRINNRILKGGVVIPLIFPKVPQAFLGILKGSPFTLSP